MRILVADDQQLTCDGLAALIKIGARNILESDADIVSFYSLSDVINHLTSPNETKPDFVFLDLNFDDEGFKGADTIRKYADHNKTNISTVVVTALNAETDKRQLRLCAEYPFITSIISKKYYNAKQFNASLKRIFDGDSWIPREITVGPIPVGEKDRDLNALYETLTTAEKRVAERLISDDSYYNIALDLALSEDHTRNVGTAIFRKMKVHNRLGFVLLMITGTNKKNGSLLTQHA